MPHHETLLDLDELRDIYDQAAMHALLRQVRQYLVADREILRAAVSNPAVPPCRRTAHRLKSMLMFLCGELWRNDFEHLECAVASADQGAIVAALARLERRFSQVDAELVNALAVPF
ncbi:hypothetical protein [Duganella violaceipulchra]|uniref:HPt domain-containing protein n=1 Tax=Duganella violaceipulchra TaxID=2849652 RepID=A0AA41L0C5_9BURK|nr:hypothetical protein [Duganella violaceicalia]MBV6322481.1 hypothetical protein [Duganella violaceicalia]MCP2010688.1 hypothetical protein [Duganella violaceicalia]